MRTKSIMLLSSVSALVVPSAALTCDMEGPGGRFSAFAHMSANMDQASPQPTAPAQSSTPASYKDDSRDPEPFEPTPTDYNAPATAPSTSDAKPSEEAVTR